MVASYWQLIVPTLLMHGAPAGNCSSAQGKLPPAPCHAVPSAAPTYFFIITLVVTAQAIEAEKTGGAPYGAVIVDPVKNESVVFGQNHAELSPTR